MRLLVMAALAVCLFAVPAASAAAPKPPSPPTAAKRALARLAADTRKLPSSAVKRTDKAALIRVARRAARARKARPCRAIGLLARYRRLLGKVRRPRGQLESDVLAARVALLALPGPAAAAAAGRPGRR